MRFDELQPLLRLSPRDLQRVSYGVLQIEPRAELELTKVQEALLLLADFGETYLGLPDGMLYDLLRRVWPVMQEHFREADVWTRPYQIGVADRRYAVWPGYGQFYDLSTLKDLPEFPGYPVQLHTVDLIEYHRRALLELQRRAKQRR